MRVLTIDPAILDLSSSDALEIDFGVLPIAVNQREYTKVEDPVDQVVEIDDHDTPV